MCNSPEASDSPSIPVQKAAGIFGRPGIGSAVGDAREAADGAAALVAQAQRILTDLETGAAGLDLTIGPFDVYGFAIPAIPLHFKLAR